MTDIHGRFVWYELMTTDMAAAAAFYTAVLGWDRRDASAPGMPYTLFTVNGASVAGAMALPGDALRIGAEPRWVGYVAVDDVDAATARLQRLGGAVFVPPTDVPEFSRFAIVADPQAAAFALLKWFGPGRELPSDGALGHVGWHELLAADWTKAFAFYKEIFGWHKAEADTRNAATYQMFASGGQTIGGMFTKPAGVPKPFWLYYFSVDDIGAAAERVTANGGKILEGPVEAPGRWVVRCTDPQGAIFALTGQKSGSKVGTFTIPKSD